MARYFGPLGLCRSLLLTPTGGPSTSSCKPCSYRLTKLAARLYLRGSASSPRQRGQARLLQGPFWDHFGTILEEFWDHFGPCWDHFGPGYRSRFRDRFNVKFAIINPPSPQERFAHWLRATVKTGGAKNKPPPPPPSPPGPSPPPP